RRRATTNSLRTGPRRTRRASTISPASPDEWPGADPEARSVGRGSAARPRAGGRSRMSLVTRVLRTRERMDELGVDVVLLSVGADLPYLTGYEAMPLERLTMLVLP